MDSSKNFKPRTFFAKTQAREPIPEYSYFQRRFWAGEVELKDSHTKILYGRLHWQRFLESLRQPRYDEALRIVGEDVRNSVET